MAKAKKKRVKKIIMKSTNKKKASPQVSIIMGSSSDLSVMKDAASALKELLIPFEISVVSAHRTPKEMVRFAEEARSRGVRIIIAGAGGAAHLPGMVASLTELPVIGVPVPVGELKGKDALYSIVQMPRGVPVATVAIGGAWNAGILAAQMLGVAGGKEGEKIFSRIKKYKSALRQKVLAMKVR